MKQLQALRIVVASPGDVRPERDVLEKVATELNHGVAADRGLRLEISRWETDAYPGFHPEGPQGQLDALLRIADCDVLIGIFWKRFGAAAGEAPSDAEHEFGTAYEAWRNNGRPQILVYFNQRSYTPRSKEETDQWGEVLEFQKNFPKEGLWWPYDGKAEFERLARSHLTQLLRQRFPPLLADRAAEEAQGTGAALDRRFAELQQATETQTRSLHEEIACLHEALRRGSERAREVARDPIPIPLPSLRGTFVDREAERDTLRRLLRAGEMRLLVLVAPGGYGKTELTTKVLTEVARGGDILAPDVAGILYLRCLRGEVRLGRIFAEAGRIAGQREAFERTYASVDLTLERKLEFFFRELSRAGSVWLVLDNFEDLLDGDDAIADPELRRFVETAVSTEHSVRLLATTRAVPRFPGSHRLRPIDLSAGLPEDQAIEYLRAEGAACGLADADEELLRAFVRRVHGIPKALESVIGYLSEKHPVVALSDLMADDAWFGDFDRYDAENGLKRLIAEQFADQAPDARLTLCALSLFPKPVPLAALRYLLPALDGARVLPRLERNKLVNRHGDRWDLHPLVREFAYGQIPDELPLSPDAAFVAGDANAPFHRPDLHARAADFYKELRAPQDQWKNIADLEPQLDEFYHRVRAGQYDEAARVLNLIDYDYLELWGHERTILELRKELDNHLTDVSLANINIGRMGRLYSHIGDISEAIRCYEKGSGSARGDQDIATWLSRLGSAYFETGWMDKATDCFERAMAIYRRVGDQRGEGHELANLGWVKAFDGDFVLALRLFKDALATGQEISERRFTANYLTGVAWAEHWLGNLTDARRYYEDGLVLDVPPESCWCAIRLGIICREESKEEEAQRCFTRGIDLCRAMLNNTPNLITPLFELALAQLGMGQTDAALATYRQALNIFSGQGVVKEALQALQLLQRAAPDTTGLTEAIALLEEALRSPDAP